MDWSDIRSFKYDCFKLFNNWFIVICRGYLVLLLLLLFTSFKDAVNDLFVLPAKFVVLNHVDDWQKDTCSDFKVDYIGRMEE